MRSSKPLSVVAVAAVASAAVVGALAAWTPARGQESAVAKPAVATPVSVSLPSKPPKGAVVLFGGKPEELRDNWYRRYTTEPANWTAEKGVATPLASAKTDITSWAEFGDSYVHAEFRTPVYPASERNGHGNSGIALQGRYEVQILGDHGKAPGRSGAGSLYSQKPPIVNASKPAGEWQTMDIIFRAPRFDEAGKVVEKPRATVFQNGVLVQNNEEFTGMTGIQYGQYKEMAKTGPVVLQGDHDLVQFRNVWVVPL